MPKKLAIVGGGPKAAAIVARAAVLRDLLGDNKVPEIDVYEKNGVGSAWSGDDGFSSGHLTLCSPAEKDVGFPYADVLPRHDGKAIAPILYGRFSWSSFLVADGQYAEWVDRGRDYPAHRLWAEYLAWVFLQAGQGVVEAQVLDVAPQAKGGWHIRYRDGPATRTSYADAVVLTGTGQARPLRSAVGIPDGRIFDAETFWDAREDVLEFGEIAVVGAGGAAGAIIAWLSHALSERSDATIRSISPMGTLFARGDGYAERRWFSDPTDWRELSLADRKKLAERTENGVISQRNKSIIDNARNIAFVHGHATNISWDGSELKVDLEYDRRPTHPVKADCVINAIGFDSWSLLNLVDEPARAGLLAPAQAALRETAAENMLPNLSFGPGANLGEGLHVPVLASLAHGPGMGTLGCLGLVAKSVLDGYLE
ncbi:hypothetical protein CAF53_01865 [Sphingobium sp. LB126]|uniref:FAD/NAD(P)-binding protein n=1 Tax=Sphingobium sp. LB126 TaxID=1983755 RepID=UPI000C20F6F0|nr:FAD/NAD(P)-binding protein [Sphingobium sp. LB126]PJG47122.1 hypothetical protein CAF53_01865 [Sphingobium sp. LB126]